MDAKEQHIKDAKNVMLNLKSDTQVNETDKEYRNKCLLEFIKMIDTGKTDHINVQDDIKEPEHFK